jgi:DNA-binding MarR family transcriptional regulator
MDRQTLISTLLKDSSLLKRSMRALYSGYASAHAISPAQVTLLCILARHESRSIKELATELGMTSSACTQLVDILVQQRLLTRTENRQDRRKTSITLTEAGKKNLGLVQKQRAKYFTKLLAPLTDKEIVTLVNLQQKIISHLT